MPSATHIAQARTLSGEVFAAAVDGRIRPLRPGDLLQPGEAVVTGKNAQIALQLADGRQIELGGGEKLSLDAEVSGEAGPADSALVAGSDGFRALAAALGDTRLFGEFDELLVAEAPAAGSGGPVSEGGHSFVEFQRIAEEIADGSPGYRFGTDDRDAPALVAGAALLADVAEEVAETPGVPDTTPPNGGAAPLVTIVEDANNDGFINRSELNGEVDVRIGFDGALVDVGDVIRVTVAGVTLDIIVSATDKASGYVDLALPAPPHGTVLEVEARIVDPAGNSSATDSDSAKIDTSDLSGLKVSIVEDADGDGWINKGELDGNIDIRIDLPPEAIAGDLLTIDITGQPTRAVILTQADIDAGRVLFDIVPPANGVRIEVSAQVSDPAGNRSNVAGASATLALGDPAAPVVVIREDSNQDGYIDAAELSGDIDVRVELPASAQAGDLLFVTINGVARLPILLTQADIADQHVDLAGIASPGHGHSLTVSAWLRDSAGNLGPAGEASAIIDTTVFAGLAVKITEDRNDDGYISISEFQDDDIDVRVTLPAGAAVGDSLTVSASGNVDQVAILSAADLAAGYVDLKFNPTADNIDFVATACIADLAGNSAGPVSDSARLLLSEPGAPIVTIVEDSNDDGWVSAAELDGEIDVSITLPGTAAAGDTLLLAVNGSALAPIVLTLADINRGSVAVPGIASPGEGQAVEVTAQVRDAAGNLGGIGSDRALIDTTAPNGGLAPVVTIIEDADGDKIISAAELDGEVDVRIGFNRGLVDAGDVVVVTDGSVSHEIIITAADQTKGYVSTHFPPQADGTTLTVEALIRDAAGNATPRGVDSVAFSTALMIADLTVSVSEEGLPHGLPDTSGVPADTTDAASVSGALHVVNGSAAVSFCLLAPDEILYADGVRIVWSGAGTEDSPLIGRAGTFGPEIICASIDAQGNYRVSLLRSVDHADASGEDVATLNFTVKASDGSRQDSAMLMVHIEDDAPLAADQSFRIGDGDGADTNLMIVLDVSASMRECVCVKDLAGHELSRLDLARLAINDLLDRYAAQGEVKVRLVVFGNDGEAIGDRWLSIAEARAALAGIEASGEASNYDAALAAARLAWAGDGRLGDGQNVSWFLSDGVPTTDGSGNPFNYSGQFDPILGDGIDRNEEAAWRQFLNDNDIVSQASGVGPRSLIVPSQLNPVAWDGVGECDLDGHWISDFTEMSCVFANAVSGPTTLTGSLGAFGADGGHVAVVTVDGCTFTYDAQSNTLTASGNSDTLTSYRFDPLDRSLSLTTSQGETLRIGLCDGSYRYHADQTPPRGSQTEVRYTLVDGDGDSAGGALRFIGTGAPEAANVAPVVGVASGHNLLGIIGLEALDLVDLGPRTSFTASDANNDLVRVEIAYRALVNLGPYHLQASQALADELGLILTISNDPGLLGLILPSSTLTITARDGGTIDNLALNELLGTVHYEQSLLDASVLSATTITAVDSHGLSSTASIGSLAEVSLLHSPDSNPRLLAGGDGADTLTASVDGSRLYGHAGDDQLQGSAGNDLLRGGAGDDDLDGGAGNDLLIGGSGNDILVGGAGSDVFRWEFGDRGTAAAPAVDRILDFDAITPVGAGGDVLDLRDLLQGEYHDGGGIGNLGQYLRVEAGSARTLIHIDPLGNGSPTTQTLILEGVDLSAGGIHAGNAQIIEQMLQQGRLLTD